jgi:hypothetical protein
MENLNVQYRGIEIEIVAIPYGYRYTYDMTVNNLTFTQTYETTTYQGAVAIAQTEIDGNLENN